MICWLFMGYLSCIIMMPHVCIHLHNDQIACKRVAVCASAVLLVNIGDALLEKCPVYWVFLALLKPYYPRALNQLSIISAGLTHQNRKLCPKLHRLLSSAKFIIIYSLLTNYELYYRSHLLNRPRRLGIALSWQIEALYSFS